MELGRTESRRETERTHALDGIAKAAGVEWGVQTSAKPQTGFEWLNASSAWQKVQEEEKEPRRRQASDPDRTEEELGDLFFALAVYARKLGLEPETALNRANNKFQRRFQLLEEQVRAAGKEWKDLSAEEWEAGWNRAKTCLRQQSEK